jgi:hypothetical protein
MEWTMTPATPFTIGNVTTCYVAEIVFQNPITANTSATPTSATPTPTSTSLSAGSSTISFSTSSSAITFKTTSRSVPKKSQSQSSGEGMDIMKVVWSGFLAVVVGLL